MHALFARRARKDGDGQGSQHMQTALTKATANTLVPIAPHEMLQLMSMSEREPPAMVAAWCERMDAMGVQPEAALKMLTVLHRLQLHNPAFAAVLPHSSIHGRPLSDALQELSERLEALGEISRGPFIRAYLHYLRLRMAAPDSVAALSTWAREPRSADVAAGASSQRLMDLGKVLEEVPRWEGLFDGALDAFEAAQVTPLTQEPLILLLRDANGCFVIINDSAANAVETHFEVCVDHHKVSHSPFFPHAHTPMLSHISPCPPLFSPPSVISWGRLRHSGSGRSSLCAPSASWTCSRPHSRYQRMRRR